MDAFLCYNQILMSEEDQEKTLLVTNQGLHYYKVMPFGLKNVRTTCQRLVNHVSSKQIGKNVKVYVDNMLTKSREVCIWHQERIEANPKNVKAILDMASPKNSKGGTKTDGMNRGLEQVRL